MQVTVSTSGAACRPSCQAAVTVKTEDEEVELEALDSCYLAPNEARSVVNKRHRPATMLVISTNA